MKKFLTLFITLILCLSMAFSFGCGNNDSNNDNGADKNPEQNTVAWTRMDIQKLYDSETEKYPQAVLMVKKSVLDSNSNLVSTIKNAFNENVAWAKENTKTAIEAVNTAMPEGISSSMKAPAMSPEVIDNCKISWQDAKNAVVEVKDYINSIKELNNKLVGEVNDDLFYSEVATAEVTGATSEKKAYNFFMPDGAPALAVAKFINDKQNFGLNGTVNYKVVQPDVLGPQLVKGIGDFIIMPVNMASKIYKACKTDEYKMVSVITHGNVYLMSSDGTNSLDSLKGKVVALFGQNKVPDITFRMVLKKNNLLDLVVVGDTATEGKITFKYLEAPEVVQGLKSGIYKVGLLAEPAATSVTKLPDKK